MKTITFLTVKKRILRNVPTNSQKGNKKKTKIRTNKSKSKKTTLTWQ